MATISSSRGLPSHRTRCRDRVGRRRSTQMAHAPGCVARSRARVRGVAATSRRWRRTLQCRGSCVRPSSVCALLSSWPCWPGSRSSACRWRTRRSCLRPATRCSGGAAILLARSRSRPSCPPRSARDSGWTVCIPITSLARSFARPGPRHRRCPSRTRCCCARRASSPRRRASGLRRARVHRHRRRLLTALRRTPETPARRAVPDAASHAPTPTRSTRCFRAHRFALRPAQGAATACRTTRARRRPDRRRR